MQRALIYGFCHNCNSSMPPELIKIILGYAYDLRIGKSSCSYWYFCAVDHPKYGATKGPKVRGQAAGIRRQSTDDDGSSDSS